MPNAIKQTLLVFILLLGMTILWRFLADAGYLNEVALLQHTAYIRQFEYSLWSLIGITLLYVALLAIMFPLTILVVTTGMLFSTEWAIFCATLASLSSSAMGYVVGHWVGRETIEKHGGEMVRRAEKYIQKNSFNSMVLINLLPVAPFTMTNMLAGAFRLDFTRYMLGSAVGIIPGLIIVIAFGGQLSKLIATNENGLPWSAIVIAILLVIVLVGLLVYLDKRFNR
ncbi:TVP38/TMEM64 family protein [Methylophaga pinxianii]|uniref:TVP38/TMEM64 family protein n=1 Tax=Methylophaga TaxID=40222 RepID=UPI001CF1BE77|nr:VTT domain-containing protein [Methylophaga pinxianii]MCB2425505.1 VTT domain-containing protein [Methylophaga pinxianii]UPH46138.1 VTT domain-containing protein [Methylophaga pinxianii]